MKQALIILFANIIFLSSSCNPNSKNDNSKGCDSNAIIQNYLLSLGVLDKNDTAKFNKESFLKDRIVLPKIKPADIPNGKAIDLPLGIAEVDSFMSHLSPTDVTTLRSFYVNADLFSTYLGSKDPNGDPLCDGTKIKFFKFYFGVDTAKPHTTRFVIVAYDSNGNYIYLPKNSTTNNYQVFNQIAPCPSVCPSQGQAEYDGIYTGTVIPTPRDASNLGTIIPRPNSKK